MKSPCAKINGGYAVTRDLARTSDIAEQGQLCFNVVWVSESERGQA